MVDMTLEQTLKEIESLHVDYDRLLKEWEELNQKYTEYLDTLALK